MEERIPPHSDDAERSVLGAVMKNKEALFDVLEILTPEDFYSEIHKEIFGAVRDLNRASSPVDVLTVSEELKKLVLKNGEQPITHRPADDIAPQMDKMRADLAAKGYPNASVEDVLSYALFPEVALEYFKKNR